MNAAAATSTTVARLRSSGRAWAATTPAWLRLASLGTVLLTLVCWLVTASAVSSRHSATDSAWLRTEPALIDAQTVYTSLSDADTTAAGAFLAGPLEPAALRARYENDLAQAAASLALASQQAGSAAPLTRSLVKLSVGVPFYSGLIETARADNRQGFPVGAAYLGEANNLMRTGILPAASNLYQAERQRLLDDHRTATQTTFVIVAAVLLVALLVALAYVQRRFSARFRRTLNVPLLGATAAVIVLGAWLAIALYTQGHNLTQAEQQGSAPISTYTQARILALQARADDELTLVTRDSVPAYQSDYASVAGRLSALLSSRPRNADAVERHALAAAAAAFGSYQRTHANIRQDDTNGNLPAAVALASGPGRGDLPTVSGQLDGVLTGAIAQAQQRFNRASSGADSDLSGLTWGIAVLSILTAALVLAGAQQRIAEYR